jgi:hypothetical protein
LYVRKRRLVYARSRRRGGRSQTLRYFKFSGI